MTISNNVGSSQLENMKEVDSSFTSESDIQIESKANRLTKTDNLDLFGVKTLRGQAETIRLSNQTHTETNINIKHTAQPGKEGFLSAIKNFFVGLFLPEVQMPETVTVNVAGDEIKVNGERFRGMIEALPKGQRKEAAGSLGNRITARLSHIETLLSSVLSGEQVPPASTQDVSDLMLFIQLRHEALHPKESFTNGAYSIEDPEGHLADFLDSCNEGYNRFSSHLKGLQNVPLGDGKSNAMRGIDIPGGVMTGLLDKRGTIHYGSIPQQEGVEGSARRLFIMTERHGCRLSLRSLKFWTKSFWVNTSGRAHRSTQFSDIRSAIKLWGDTSGRAHRSMQFSDIGRVIKHACNYFKTSDEKSGINYRSEKLRGLSPKDIAETFKGLSLCEKLDELKPYFSKDGTKRLPENARLVQTLEWLDIVEVIARQNHTKETQHLKSHGIKTMDKLRQEDYSKFFKALDSIKSKLINGIYTDNPNHEDRNTGTMFSWFLKSTELDHPDRLGNEVMMSLDDFQELNKSILGYINYFE